MQRTAVATWCWIKFDVAGKLQPFFPDSALLKDPSDAFELLLLEEHRLFYSSALVHVPAMLKVPFFSIFSFNVILDARSASSAYAL